MKAFVCEKYGPPEIHSVKEVEKPIPKENEVLLKVFATSATTHNLLGMMGKPLFIRLMEGSLFRPKVRIPGSDFSGRVAAVGVNVKRFKPGDEVYGESSLYGFGALAEYLSVPEQAVNRKPANITFEEAAAVPQAALVALQGLRDKGKIKPGQQVLIYGASGGIGTFAVQIAKYFGAEVTGVCSTGKLDLIRSLGVDRTIDYTQEDFTKSGTLYDMIFAVAYRSIRDMIKALKPGGIYVSVGGPFIKRIYQDMVIGPRLFRSEGKRIAGGCCGFPLLRRGAFQGESNYKGG